MGNRITFTGSRRTIAEAGVLAAVLTGLVASNAAGIYDGANKGVFVGNCGIEFVGEPGFFCSPSYESMGDLISASKASESIPSIIR